MKKFLQGLLLAGLVVGCLSTPINASEEETAVEEKIEETEKQEVKKESTPVVEETKKESTKVEKKNKEAQSKATPLLAGAPADWAFTDESRPLELAIMAKYNGTGGNAKVDTNGDNFISISEALAYNQAIVLNNQVIGGTLAGIENFKNITALRLNETGVAGVIPSGIGDMTQLNMLELGKNNLTGEIPTSITNLNKLTTLILQYNKLEGNIPTDLGSMSKLSTIVMYSNNLTGAIPSSISSLTKLARLDLGFNNLTGGIPASLGNLSDLWYIGLEYNQLEGEIPSQLGNLSKLKFIILANNNLEGNIPESLGTLPLLSQVLVPNNPKLSGNVAEIFAPSTSLSFLDIRGTSTIQSKPAVSTLTLFLRDLLDEKGAILPDLTQSEIDFVFDSATNATAITGLYWGSHKDDILDLVAKAQDTINKNNDAIAKVGDLTDGSGAIKDTTTQDQINEAQDAVDKLPDGPLKDDLQDKINDVQNQYDERDAKNKVDDLTDGSGVIKDSTTQDKIDEAQEAVDKLPDGPVKEDLQDKIDDVQNQYDERDAKNKVDDLTDGSGVIKDSTTQDKIDEAQEAVDKLPDGPLKDDLQDKINDVQDQLDERNATYAVLKNFDKFTGSGNVTGRIDAPVKGFSKVYVNGTELDNSNYTITSGSTVVTLLESYLSTLSNGTYSVVVEYANGKTVALPLEVAKQVVKPSDGNTNSKASTAVKTGTNDNMAIYAMLLGSAGLALIFVLRKKLVKE